MANISSYFPVLLELSPRLCAQMLTLTAAQVLDYSQFSLSLAKSAAEARAVWELHYNFSSHFQTDVITPRSMDQVPSTATPDIFVR